MKKKIEPAPAAAKAEPTKPAPPQTPAAPLMTANLKLELDPPRVSPPTRGPMTGMTAMDPGAFIQAYASAEELARFAAEVRARQARERETWIFSRCSNPTCRFVMKHKPEPDGSFCPRCNLARRRDGGHLFAMNEKATNAYLYSEALKEKAATEQLRLRAFHAENAARQAKGDRPLTLDEFKRQQQSDFEERRRQDAELGKALRRQP